MASSSGGLDQTYAIICLNEHLDTGAHEPFTRWANALAIPDASAPTTAQALDQQVFCYFGLPDKGNT